ncbi:efflux RND transporter periplasmic adaptor subunit [Pleurocapsales cyanobacterium LEGE 06147]|nr:efflux RND transporter periplasmic adaptor subunit [Pleurocapsales cyanobacterium LEGE 06147]
MGNTDLPLPLWLFYRLSGAFLSLILLTAPTVVLAHAGHGDEFQGSNATGETLDSVRVDAETVERLGITVEPVTKKQLDAIIKTTGQIETLPSRQVEVTTPVEGAKVVELLVEPGDKVESGQPVAVLYSPQLVELRVNSQEKRAEAEADLQQARADLELARQNYEKFSQIATDEIAQARSQLAFAREKYEKDKQLADSGALPQRDALESETQYKEAQANLTKALSRREVIDAEAQLKRARAAVEVAQSRLQLSDSVYQTRLAQLGTRANAKGLVTITAPISGRVADREVTLGQSFQDAGGKLMTIVNDSRVYTTANIYEKDLNKIRIGQRVSLRLVSVPNSTFSGQITIIGSVVQGETQVVPVKAEIENSGGLLKPGMFAELEVLTDRTATPILAIPNSAVVEANGKQLIYLQNGNVFQSVEVTLGQTAGNWVEVKSGLFEGDAIVTQRAPQLYAQSLRGENQSPAEEHHVERSQETTRQTTETKTINFPIPWWMGATGGAALFGAAFVTGAFWSSRRTSSRLGRRSNSESEGFVSDIEDDLDNHKQTTRSGAIARAKDLEEPRY